MNYRAIETTLRVSATSSFQGYGDNNMPIHDDLLFSEEEKSARFLLNSKHEKRKVLTISKNA